VLVLGAVAALLATDACGVLADDDDGHQASEGAPLDRLRVPHDLDESAGCGEESATDTSDLSAGRLVARCAADHPAAAPLAQPATVRVGVRRLSEDVAPVLLAEHFDEFAAEDLTVDIEEYGTAAELFAALDRGEVDVVAGQLDGPFFDTVHAGSDARVALGGPLAPAADDTATPQAGLWLRTDLLDEPDDWEDLEDAGLPLGVEDSIGDAVAYPVDSVLEQDDMSLNAVQLAVEDGETAAQQLADGDLSGAWLEDPYWRSVVETDLPIELVATNPVAESLGGVVVAGRLLDPARDRTVGLAFSRAVIRTINTYLAGDYQDDEEVVAALAEVTGQSEEDIVRTPPWVFDWEIRDGTTSRVQDAVLTLGGVAYEQPLSERQVVDRSLYEDAVGSDPAQDQG
jgi:NitT/TauT family transport system substrate-binding protein